MYAIRSMECMGSMGGSRPKRLSIGLRLQMSSQSTETIRHLPSDRHSEMSFLPSPE